MITVPDSGHIQQSSNPVPVLRLARDSVEGVASAGSSFEGSDGVVFPMPEAPR